MPISALPQSTVHLLGSSVTITTPCDLVKELVDNAIDAKATSIEVVISPNSIDKITVRDDGQGIDVDDFDSLGRRSYTSKLKTFDELETRAGETLGFRGEALASANSLSTVHVTTRTTCDPVASRLQLKFGVGGVDSRRTVSAPVGTTIQATKLFENLPARKQYALKNSHKHITAIKELLKSYALARPCLRLSFKIHGDSAYSWSYAPNFSPTVHEAVLQIFGKNLAANCMQISHMAGCDRITPTRSDNAPADFILDAFVPKFNFDAHEIKAKGAYLSVDFRPVSSVRGISKKLVGIFKSHLNRVNESTTAPISPFMQLNIRCPPGSYDANLTPLKDEVLFSDEKKILSVFEAFCEKVYGQAAAVAGAEDLRLQRKKARCEVAVCREPEEANHQTKQAGKNLAHDATDEFLGPFDPNMLNVFEDLSQSSRPAHPDEDAPRQLQNAPKEPETVSTEMRTVKAVNMSRTESNATDENSAGESITIQIPRLSTLDEAPSADLTSKIRPKLFHGSGNIERYFRPAQNEEFHIASDETATAGESAIDSTQPQSHSGRLPLQPLSDSALNEIQGEAESESSASVDFGVLRPQDSLRRDLDTVVTRRSFSITDNRELEGRGRNRRTPPDSSPLSHVGRLGGFRFPAGLAGVLGLQTPPSSDHPRPRGTNAPFRPPRRSNISIGNTAQTRRRGGEMNGNVQTDLLRQTRHSLRSMANRRADQQGEAWHGANDGVVTRDGPSPGIRDVAHRDSYSPPRLGVHTLDRRTSNSTDDVFQDQTLEHESALNLATHQSGQYSHLLQTILMRSPSPVVSSAAEKTEGSMAARADYQAVVRHDTPAPDLFSQDFNHRLASNDLGTVSKVGEDPRRYFIQRQRSRAHHGRQRRLSSRRLPLEAVPDAMKLHNVSTSLGLGLRDIRLWVERFAPSEHDTIVEQSEGSLPFRDLEEARIVEMRLRATVNSWLGKSEDELAVEYTLQSAAKGKRKRT